MHGYYVTPFLLGDRLVGRVDLQRDRSAQTLRAHRVSWEAGEEHTDQLLIELREMAEWLGLTAVEIEGTHLPLS